MNNGWVKLHRKILDNPIFRNDRTGWHIFETLLILVDRDGAWSGGRIQLAQLVGEKSTTVYKALKRLEKAKMVTLVSNNRFSVISICRWSEYQSSGNSAGNTSGNNQVTTKGQPSNTLTRIKKERKKEVVPKGTTSKLAVDKRDPEITKLIKHFENRIGSVSRDQSFAAIQLLKQHGFDKSIGAINLVASSRTDRYAPSIGSLEDLEEKWLKLETYFARKIKGDGPGRVVIS